MQYRIDGENMDWDITLAARTLYMISHDNGRIGGARIVDLFSLVNGDGVL